MCSIELTTSEAGPGVAPKGVAALERQITELASHIHAATCHWLHLVAEYDRSEGWAQWSCRSCADWVSWRCGIAPEAAREHVRVARRLRELPLTREAFAAGQLSYSKVRALTRVQDVEKEDELVSLARHATAAQLERLVRGYRRVAAVEKAARGARPERWLRYDYDHDGSLIVRGRLPAEEGAIFVAAIEAARDEIARERAGVSDVSAETPDGPNVSAETPDGPDVSAETPDAPEVSAETPSSTAAEARADALVMLADARLGAAQAARSGGDRYQVVVHVDTGMLGSGAAAPNDAEADSDAAHRDLNGSGTETRCELEAGVPLAHETVRRLACDAAVVPMLERRGKPLSVGRKTRSIPPALRRALTARDDGCQFPGCGARRFVDAHHIEHWADGGDTKLTNLVQLCHHHHRLLHEGGYTVARGSARGFVFRRPDGRRIAPCPAAPPGRVAAVRERRPGDRDRARPVEPEACVSLSAGERLDLDLGVQALLTFAPLSGQAPGI